MDMCQYTFVKLHRMYEINVNYRLWVIMICQCKFLAVTMYYCAAGMLTVREALLWWRREYMDGHSVLSELSVQFSCETKTALKNF